VISDLLQRLPIMLQEEIRLFDAGLASDGLTWNVSARKVAERRLIYDRETTTSSQSCPACGGTGYTISSRDQGAAERMLPVVDKPLIQYVVEECVASGIEHIIIVTVAARLRLRITSILRRSWKVFWRAKASPIC